MKNFLLWLAFVLGALLHIYGRGKSAVRRGAWKSFEAWFLTYLDVLLIRTVLGGVIFGFWIGGGGNALIAAAKAVGMDAIIPELPVTWGTCILFGLGVDFLLDLACEHVPGKLGEYLRRQVPQIPDNGSSKSIPAAPEVKP